MGALLGWRLRVSAPRLDKLNPPDPPKGSRANEADRDHRQQHGAKASALDKPKRQVGIRNELEAVLYDLGDGLVRHDTLRAIVCLASRFREAKPAQGAVQIVYPVSNKKPARKHIIWFLASSNINML